MPVDRQIIIRDATAEDWPAIYAFFSVTVDAGETYAYPEGLSSSEARAYWMPAPPGRTVLATDAAGIVLGSASMGPNRPGRGDHIATASFMVAPAARRRGVGRELGRHVIEWARASGFRGIQFNAVVESNAGAVQLWQSLGFEIVGTVPGAFRHPRLGFVALHVMFLDLTQTPR